MCGQSTTPPRVTPKVSSCEGASERYFPPQGLEGHAADHVQQEAARFLRPTGLEPLWCGSVAEKIYRLVWMPSFRPALVVVVMSHSVGWVVQSTQFEDPRLERATVGTRYATKDVTGGRNRCHFLHRISDVLEARELDRSRGVAASKTALEP